MRDAVRVLFSILAVVSATAAFVNGLLGEYAEGAYYIGWAVFMMILIGREATVEVSIPFTLPTGGNGEVEGDGEEAG